MAQAKESIDADELNYLALRRYLAVLCEKRDIILKMDTEILLDLFSEEDIVRKIEEAGAYREKVEMVIITIEQARNKRVVRHILERLNTQRLSH